VNGHETIMLESVSAYISHFESIRRRTLNYIRLIPSDKMGWSPKPGEFSCRDIIHHLGAAEKMFAMVATEGIWSYSGHTIESQEELEAAIVSLERDHLTALNRLKSLSDGDLYTSQPSLDGTPIKVWRWLMALIEHEIHHRSQLAVYLTLMGVEAPHIFGLGVEEIISRTTG